MCTKSIFILGFCFSKSEIIGFKIAISDDEPQVENFIVSILLLFLTQPVKNNIEHIKLKKNTFSFIINQLYVSYYYLQLQQPFYHFRFLRYICLLFLIFCLQV